MGNAFCYVTNNTGQPLALLCFNNADVLYSRYHAMYIILPGATKTIEAIPNPEGLKLAVVYKVDSKRYLYYKRWKVENQSVISIDSINGAEIILSGDLMFSSIAAVGIVKSSGWTDFNAALELIKINRDAALAASAYDIIPDSEYEPAYRQSASAQPILYYDEHIDPRESFHRRPSASNRHSTSRHSLSRHHHESEPEANEDDTSVAFREARKSLRSASRHNHANAHAQDHDHSASRSSRHSFSGHEKHEHGHGHGHEREHGHGHGHNYGHEEPHHHRHSISSAPPPPPPPPHPSHAHGHGQPIHSHSHSHSHTNSHSQRRRSEGAIPTEGHRRSLSNRPPPPPYYG